MAWSIGKEGAAMFAERIAAMVVLVGLLASAGDAGAGPNADAVVSLDLIADGGPGNRTDDGVRSGTVSGRGEPIAVEVFARGVETSLTGVSVVFDFDASLVTFVRAENSDFALSLPEGSAGASLAAGSPVSLPASGFLLRASFTTSADVTGRGFAIGVSRVTLAESAASTDDVATASVIRFNAADPADFDGDGRVGFPDFLAFAGAFGTHQGGGRYEARFDLDADGAVGFSDFLLFAAGFGKETSSPDGSGATAVDVPDANLRAVIEDSLGKARSAPITRNEMATLTRLEAPNSGIRDLTGLEFATGLEVLRLGAEGYERERANSNRITDLSPILGLSRLKYLDLEWNRCLCAIPPELGNLSELTFLNLDRNRLTDGIPHELGNLANLGDLGLSYNRLTGGIPSELGNLANLRSLKLDHNRLTGGIPHELGNLANLRSLKLDLNRLTGGIPHELGNLANLRLLGLSGNQLSGAIPRELGNLANLFWLAFGGNQLSGAIPRELGDLSELTFLNLRYNRLSGAIPPELGNLAKLTYLNFSSNQFSGEMPRRLARLTRLEGFYFNDSGLCAPLDSAFQRWLLGIETVVGENCSE